MMYDFSDILGNEQIINVFRTSVNERKNSHAYILDGAKGAGKKLLANSYAKYIFCKTKKDKCTCHSCVSFDAGNHSDLVYVRPEKTKSIGVEQVRTDILQDINKKPFEYDYKIFIIENADLLTAQAQNALLRSIEEPPSYAVFLLLSENINAFLATIISRCFIYKIKPLRIEYIFNRLKALMGLNFSENRALIASEFCGGAIGRAIEILNDDSFFDKRKLINDSLTNLKNYENNLEKTFSETQKFEAFKEAQDDFIMIALMWFRDILAYKATGDLAHVLQRDYTLQIKESAGKLTFKNLYIKIESLLDFKKSLSANTPFGAALDAFTINIS